MKTSIYTIVTGAAGLSSGMTPAVAGISLR